MSDGGTINNSLWGNLPLEMVAHVLSLLPIKSQCKFKCVSPSWNSLISSPNFAKTNKPSKTILISNSQGLYSVDFAAPNLTAEKLDFPSAEGKLTYGCGSCNGLVLVCVEDVDSNSNFLLLNPFTRECKKLPQSPFYDTSSSARIKLITTRTHTILPGLGYDSSTDDYKVAMLLYTCMPESEYDHAGNVSEVIVYSLKTDSWRRIQDCHYDPVEPQCGIHFLNIPLTCSRVYGLLRVATFWVLSSCSLFAEPLLGFLFNERLHWLSEKTGDLDGSMVVAAFNFPNENFTEVHLPDTFDTIYEVEYHHMVILGGCLCLVTWPRFGDEMEVWMMTKYAVRESWIKFTILNHSRMSLGNVLHLSAEGEFVLRRYGEIDGTKLVAYNLKKETLTDLVVGGIPIRFNHGDNYIETLVSPNHGGRIRRQCEASSGDHVQRFICYLNIRNVQ
ncbi:F-box protein CPR1-like [Rhododendron vialii]|uniref:F-box protein CPR1-like n=1 Tax=Rhododendron vialii TaxID=182163 RepID=UPI00265E7E1E|nr:F-box protein CPR1-like [Rhododendron vialii]